MENIKKQDLTPNFNSASQTGYQGGGHESRLPANEGYVFTLCSMLYGNGAVSDGKIFVNCGWRREVRNN
jgi:hypothetical protein